jgi:hypothetical protein
MAEEGFERAIPIVFTNVCTIEPSPASRQSMGFDPKGFVLTVKPSKKLMKGFPFARVWPHGKRWRRAEF